MPTFTIDEHAPILVEFKAAPGLEHTTRGLPSPTDLAKQSEQAINAAMNTIHAAARRVVATIDALTERPSKVEVDFGLKLDAAAGALVAQASTEASFVVKLTWERERVDRRGAESAEKK
jgi:hypothetical protein